MTEDQRDDMVVWFSKLIATYRIDFFRGSALFSALNAIHKRTIKVINRAYFDAHVGMNYLYNVDAKDYDDLLKELRQIVKKVPLDTKAQTVIKCIFAGDWSGTIKALDKLNRECKKEDFDLFGYRK